MPSYQTNLSGRSPQRQLPLFKDAGAVFGMSKADRLAQTLEIARQDRQRILSMYEAAKATLGRANATVATYRAADKATAFRRINLLRASLRANARAIDAAKAALLALGVSLGDL